MAAKTKIPDHPIYLVHGEDEFLVAEKAREIINGLCPAEQQAEVVEVIEGEATKGEEVEQIFRQVKETMQTMGMFSEEKIIWLRDCTFLPDSAVSKYEAVKNAIKAFEEMLKAGLPPDRRIVISVPRKVSGRSAFFKTCGKVGEVYTFVKNDQPHKVVEDAISVVANLLKERGITAKQQVVVAFATRVGNDTRQLVNEVEKLDLFLGTDRRELELRDVALMVAAGRELAAWQLADAVVERNVPVAMQTLTTLLAQKQSEMAIISGLSRKFRELSLYRALVDSGMASLSSRALKWNDTAGQDMVAATLGRKPHPYVEMLTAQASRNFSRMELSRGRKLIAQTHDQLLSSALPKKLQLELLILKLLERK